MRKFGCWVLVLVVGVAFLASLAVKSAVGLAIPEELYDFYSQSSIKFYDPCMEEKSEGTCVGTLPGNNNAEKVWNYFVEADIDGISNNANAIAGIMGNFKQESNFNPFSAGGYYGIFQTSKEALRAVDDAGLGKYWGDANAPEEAIDKAIKLELDYLTQENERFLCQGSWTTTGFICNLDKVANTPEAYSDLFMVTYEDAETDDATSPNMYGSNDLVDAGARAISLQIYQGRFRYYQEAEVRRDYAKQIYDEYSSVVTCSGNNAIVETAEKFSWPIGQQPANVYTATDAYNQAALKAGDGFVIASNCSRLSAAGVCYSCARFVSLTLLESGADPDFVADSKVGDHYKPHLLNMNADGLTYYLVNSPNWREVTEYNGVGYDGLEPGDILLRDSEYKGAGDHTFIYLGDGKVAEASNGDFGAYQHEWGDDNNGFIAFRLKNSGSKTKNETKNKADDADKSLSEGEINNIQLAKNGDKQYSDFVRPAGVVSAGSNVADWDDTDTPELLAGLLEAYGDLAYQVDRAINVPWIAILVQMRYEDPNSICGKNNFWGAGCPPGTGAGGASVWGDDLGEGFVEYAKALTNGYHDQALGIDDPIEFLEKLGPTWVQGNINGAGYGSIDGMRNSVKVLEDFVNTSEGRAIVKTFEGWEDEGRSVCGSEGGGNGTCFASQMKEGDGGCTEDGYTYYWQSEGSTWGMTPYACQYMYNAACGPTAMAMIITALMQKMVTPVEAIEKANAHEAPVCGGGSNDNVAYIAEDYGLKVEPIAEDAATITQALKEGKMVITSIGPESGLTTGGHFIAIRGVTSTGKWKILDSSTYYNGGFYQDINDWEFDPVTLAHAMAVHDGGSYAISK